MKGPWHPLHQPQRVLFAAPLLATAAEKIETFLRFPLPETWADIADLKAGESFMWGLVCELEPDFPRSCQSVQHFHRPRWSRIPKRETIAAIYREHFRQGAVTRAPARSAAP